MKTDSIPPSLAKKNTQSIPMMEQTVWWLSLIPLEAVIMLRSRRWPSYWLPIFTVPSQALYTPMAGNNKRQSGRILRAVDVNSRQWGQHNFISVLS